MFHSGKIIHPIIGASPLVRNPARLFGAQVLDRGIDMSGSDMQSHSIKLAELIFQRGDDPGQPGKVGAGVSGLFTI